VARLGLEYGPELDQRLRDPCAVFEIRRLSQESILE
jgi:hypothetical protein